MATEIGKLVATFEIDTSKFNAGLRAADAGMQSSAKKAQALGTEVSKLDKSTVGLSKSVTQLSQGLNSTLGNRLPGLTSGVSNLASTLTQLEASSAAAGSSVAAAAGPIGIALAAIVAGATAAASAIYELTTSSAEVTGHLKDLAQQTGFSVETLSALGNAAQTSGGSLDTVTSALFIFESKMGEAKDTTSEMGKIFKALNIDTTDNEKALRQALAALQSMTNAEDKATLGKKLFGRSVKDLLGAMKEAGGLDEYLNEQLRRGTLITTDAANRGDKLSDSVIEMGRAFEAAKRIIADVFGPAVTQTVKDVTSALENNQGAVRAWAEDFRLAAHGLDPFISSLRLINQEVQSLSGLGIPAILQFLLKWGTAQGVIFTGLKAIGSDTQPPPMTRQTQTQLMRQMSAFPTGPTTQQLGLGNPFQTRYGVDASVRNLLGGGGGGRGGGGGGGATYNPGQDLKKILDLSTRQIQENLKLEEDDIKRSYDRRELTVASYARAAKRLEDERHQTVTDAYEKEVQDIEIASQKIKNSEQRRNFLTIQFKELEIKKLQEANKHRDNEFRLEKEILSVTRERIVTMDELLKRSTRERVTTMEGLMRFATRERIATPEGQMAHEAAAQVRPRIATDLEAALRQQYQDHLHAINRLAYETTDIIDRAIYDGFEGGIKRGFASLALGILDIIRNVFLVQLQNAIANAFQGLSSGNGGGWGGRILNILTGGLLGGVGGGFSSGAASGLGTIGMGGIGGFSNGGIVPGVDRGYDSVLALLRPGEKVIPRGQSAGTTIINYTIQLPPAPRGGYVSPKSARQQAEMIMGHIKGSQA